MTISKKADHARLRVVLVGILFILSTVAAPGAFAGEGGRFVVMPVENRR